MSKTSECEEIGSVIKDGRIVSRDLLLFRDGQPFIVTVGTGEFISDLNKSGSGSANICLINEIGSPEENCKALSALSEQEIFPYLTAQEVV